MQLEKRKAERALQEEREKALKLERELEGWKGMGGRPGTSATRRGSGMGWGSGVEENGIQVPKRKSSVGMKREMSMSKGFL